MTFFRILWGIDIVLALIAVAVFLIGLGDGTVSSVNLGLWGMVLGGFVIVVFGSRALTRSGRTRLGAVLAAIPAIPGVLYGLLLAAAVIGGVRWN